jgi:membrane fusion protein, multidrug efflux system
MFEANPNETLSFRKASPPSSQLARWLLWAVLCSTMWTPACSEKKAEQSKTPPAIPVTVAAAVQRTVPIQIRTIGNVEAYATVGIKPRIMGELFEVHFREGDEVKRGDLLFTFDPRPYQTALTEAQAKLARNAVLARNAEMDAKRYAELVQKNYVSQEKYNEVRSNAEALRATLNADQAAVESARLQLSYCTIYAPISGRTGDLLADAGNTIKANPDDPMVYIRQIQPIQVSFAVPEKHLAEIQRYAAAGTLKVGASIPGDNAQPIKGQLTFIDNSVNTATGTIRLKATFENSDRRLWPGQFVDVALTLAERPNALTIPSAAIQSGQLGIYVFVVKPDATVEIRPITIGFYTDQDAVVDKGLQAGENVVIDGQSRLVPGARADIKNPVTSPGSPS